ncbi:MAG: multidrug ABC transporter substrate-binding protein [Ectothiorhodospiraceae bacterium]|nr:multidrug ABC transporter substrate-binding protein [Ectothiorhodospiraceae bacterium]
MKYLELLRVALQSLGQNKARSALTMLGVIIGVAAVISVVAIGQGAQHNVQESIKGLGSNILIVFPGSSSRGGFAGGAGSLNRLRAEHAEVIRNQATGISAVSPVINAPAQVIYGNNNWATIVAGVEIDYMYIREWEIAKGTFFTPQESRSAAKVCVLGKTVAEELFPNEDPVDKTIRLRNMPFKVAGVLAPKGQTSQGHDQDDVILAPFGTVQKRVRNVDYVHSILLSAKSESEIPFAQQEVAGVLRAAMRIGGADEDPFTVRTQTEISEAATSASETFTSLLYSVAAVSLLVGGIGIMNIMLVSVTERTREIGIRRAIGAQRTDILRQFLIEALFLSVSGGLIGIGLGIGASHLISSLQEWPTLIAPEAIGLALSVSGAIGIFFGYYPARKASLLDPIDALRYE